MYISSELLSFVNQIKNTHISQSGTRVQNVFQYSFNVLGKKRDKGYSPVVPSRCISSLFSEQIQTVSRQLPENTDSRKI